MAKPCVVLIDPDENYISPLEFKFLEELGEDAELEVITDERYLDVFLSHPHEIEALLIAEQWYGAGFGGQNISHLFILTEDEQYEKTRDLGVEYTFKYSSLNLIFNKVMGVCTRLKPFEEGSPGAKVVLFYSPVGGSGSTTAALAVAAALQGTYRRVLYVDAEHMQSFECFLEGHQSVQSGLVRGMARLSGNAFENVREHIAHEGFDYLPPLKSAISTYGIEFNFFSRFIAAARDSGAYDFIVVDTESSFDGGIMELIALADYVVVIATSSRSSVSKALKFRNNVENVGDEKYKFICSMFHASDEADLVSLGGTAFDFDDYIEFIDDAEDQDLVTLSSAGGFVRLAEMLG